MSSLMVLITTCVFTNEQMGKLFVDLVHLMNKLTKVASSSQEFVRARMRTSIQLFSLLSVENALKV